MLTAKNDFKTTNQKFKAGAEIVKSTVENFDFWKARGFITDDAVVAAAPVAETVIADETLEPSDSVATEPAPRRAR